MDRWRDWQRQSEGDRSAALALRNAGNWDWCCFACHQSAEKALKAALEHLRREHSGHSLNYLLRALDESRDPASRQVRDACARLNRFYIPTRYPDAFDQGAPVEQYTESDADAALLDLELVLEHARAALRETEN